ncbi:hypothetical protein SAMN05216522_11746 [Rosenbergiella nectarea]|uniref:Uncharacterized protein n=1 Tax=Rosenbergiella nectarea TaxID=988801 RepID=A0A1H9MR43_9GAMM|nr:hypothetical protein [Rosenbergiella nectarea]SER26098.1 hypothetical protein SAMN05216522_11746 [Rosenbergiella nectarea]
MQELPIPKFTWTLHKDSNFSVQVVGWHSGRCYSWNVYANIFDSHPLFNSTDGIESIPMHCGITYDQLITTGFIEKKYDWQKDSQYRVVGSDYTHLYDNYEECAPSDGIPYPILVDARELIAYLLGFEPNK